MRRVCPRRRMRSGFATAPQAAALGAYLKASGAVAACRITDCDLAVVANELNEVGLAAYDCTFARPTSDAVVFAEVEASAEDCTAASSAIRWPRMSNPPPRQR